MTTQQSRQTPRSPASAAGSAPRAGSAVAATDRRLLRRASFVVALQTGLAVAAVVAVVIALVYTISLQERQDATEGKVRDKAGDPQRYGVDPTGPAPLVVDGLPAGCTDGDVRDATAGLGAGAARVQVCGAPFLVYIVDAGVDSAGTRVTAAASFVEQQEETRRLARLCVVVGLAGVLLAAGLAWVLARRAVRPLGEALTAQRRFVSDASHELRTPLAIMLTRSQLLHRGPAYDEDQRAEIGQLVADTRVMADVVDDMLLAAEMTHLPRATEQVDLEEVADQVRATFAARAQEAEVGLTAEVVGPRGRHTVEGTTRAVRRAVAALVDNALGHVEPGGRVTVRVDRDAEHVLVHVEDDGSGLDPSRVPELIQRFRRGPELGGATDPADPSGTAGRLGLGLALVDEVVRAHDGSMQIEGRRGVGTRVTLRLPAHGEPPG